jgi:trehalose 6-phosphate synthase
VNTRNGVLMLSENTGSHEELADCALSVNPFDIQEQADTIHRALTMSDEERRVRAERLREVIFERNPGDWVDQQLADIEKLRRARAGGAEPARTGAGPA